MKTKDFKKRLTLNKKTIANLNNGQLAQAKGGAPSGTCETCETCYTYCPPCPPWVPIEPDPTAETCTCYNSIKFCDPIPDTSPEICTV